MSEITVVNNQNFPLMVSLEGLLAIPGKPAVVDSEDAIVKSVIENNLVSVLSPQEPVQVAESTQETIPTEEEISPEVVAEDPVVEPEITLEATEEAPEAEKPTSTRTTRKKTSTQVKES
jgi:hypothetical protein